MRILLRFLMATFIFCGWSIVVAQDQPTQEIKETTEAITEQLPTLPIQEEEAAPEEEQTVTEETTEEPVAKEEFIEKEQPKVEEEQEATQEEVSAEASAPSEESPTDQATEEEVLSEATAEEKPAEDEEEVQTTTEEVTEETISTGTDQKDKLQTKETDQQEEVSEQVPTEQKEEKATEEEVPPQKSKEEVSAEKEEPPIKIEEIEGIDTVDLQEPRGNWLFKRIWWERAENKYEKIRTLVQEILELRMQFFTQRSEVDKNILDPFYIEVGLGKGEFQEVIAQLTNKLEQEREKGEVLKAQERDLLTTLQKESTILEQLALDIKAINQLDVSVDNALNQLMEQINRVRGYERDAWRYFKEISRVLSDKKARALFYKMEIILNNVKDMREYIKQTFTQHFEKVISTIKEYIERIKSNVQAFKEKGIDFKEQAQKLVEGESVQPQPVEEIEEELDEQEKGWIQSTIALITNAITTIWDYTVYLIKLPYNMIFGPKEVEETEMQETMSLEIPKTKEPIEVEEQVQEEMIKKPTIPMTPKPTAPAAVQPTIEIPTIPQAPAGQSVSEEITVEETEKKPELESTSIDFELAIKPKEEEKMTEEITEEVMEKSKALKTKLVPGMSTQ